MDLNLLRLLEALNVLDCVVGVVDGLVIVIHNTLLVRLVVMSPSQSLVHSSSHYHHHYICQVEAEEPHRVVDGDSLPVMAKYGRRLSIQCKIGKKILC